MREIRPSGSMRGGTGVPSTLHYPVLRKPNEGKHSCELDIGKGDVEGIPLGKAGSRTLDDEGAQRSKYFVPSLHGWLVSVPNVHEVLWMVESDQNMGTRRRGFRANRRGCE